jgi:hypothetical protein
MIAESNDAAVHLAGSPAPPAITKASYAACCWSTFSTHSGQNTGSRLDQPGAVAALSLID